LILAFTPGKNAFSISVKLGLLVIVAGLLTWRIMALGLAEHYIRQGGPPAITQALSWDPDDPAALLEQGRLLAEQESPTAETLLINSVQEDPTNAQAYIALADWWEKQGMTRQASDLITVAANLAPQRVPIQLAAAAFRLRQGQLEQALSHWNVALALRPSVRQTLYPVLLQLLTEPQARPALFTVFNEIPSWWGSFFIYAANKAEALDTVRLLYRLMRTHDQPLDSEQRRHYIARLQREQHWLEAYFVWLNHLDTQQRKVLGNVFNGGFELPLSDEDFAWRTPSVQGVGVDTATTAGSQGDKALRIVFQGKPVRFRHLYQRLALSAGRYRLQGLLKLDSLRATHGIQWQLQCQPNPIVLGTSERFLGTAPWQPFFFDFDVPVEDCPSQELRLVLMGRSSQDFTAQGTAWFDAISIIRKGR
jgi:tetratricopeptide (TPR) repeat protein